MVRTLQAHWPETRITWIIGKTEHELISDIQGIDFIIFDKKLGWRAYLEVKKQLHHRQFDALLHMQMSLRASLISLLVKAPIKLGFDRSRAKDGQWLFTNAQIAPRQREHVLDSLHGFSDALGATNRLLKWDIPIPKAAEEYAAQILPDNQPILIISPCSSMAYRNWTLEGYAQVAEYAIMRHEVHIILCGGPSSLELEYGNSIIEYLTKQGLDHGVTNLIGRTNLKQLLALLKNATCLISPDSGPAHLATAVGTPVLGLYACTNPDRARPYLSEQWLINRYEEALQMAYGKTSDLLPWGKRVRDNNAMELIRPEDVCHRLDYLLYHQKSPTSII